MYSAVVQKADWAVSAVKRAAEKQVNVTQKVTWHHHVTIVISIQLKCICTF